MKGVLMLLIVLTMMPSVSALVQQGSSYQAVADYHSPILFVPGIMGTALEDDNRYVWADELWPGGVHEDRSELSLKDNGEDPVIAGTDIKPVRVIRTIFGSPIYNGFYVYMDERTPYVYNGKDPAGDSHYIGRAYFDRPYDFRLATEEHLEGDGSIEEDVERILKHTNSDKIILVAHSMGGLQAKMYAAKHPDKVRAVIFLSSPLNGAPRGFQSLTEGYNFGAGALISEGHVWQIGHNWPGVHHLMPNYEFVTQDGTELSLQDSFTKGVNYQRAQSIPGSFFEELRSRGITDPAAIDAAIEERFGGLNPQLVENTGKFREKLDRLTIPNSVRVEIIHGENQNTTQSYIARDEKLTFLYMVGNSPVAHTFTVRRFEKVDDTKGDETVATEGFQWSRSENTQTVNFGHMAMAGEPETLDLFMEIVEDLNHDERDGRWLFLIRGIAAGQLVKLIEINTGQAVAESEALGRRYKNANTEDADQEKLARLTGDIRGRGAIAFFQGLVIGGETPIQIVAQDAGEYADEEDFLAWIVLKGYTIEDSGIGKIGPARYTVTMDKETFLALMDGSLRVEEAWMNDRIKVSGGLKDNLLLFVGRWLQRFIS